MGSGKTLPTFLRRGDVMKWLCVLLPLTMFACTPKSGEVVPPEPPRPSAIAFSEVSSGHCFNLEKFSRAFQDPQFNLPAAIMTTDLKPNGTISPTKLSYYSYATFNYKAAQANEMGLFTQVRQRDCKTVQMLTASEEVLTYQVTNVAASGTQITIKLQDKFRDTLNAAYKKALFERQQPYEYTFKYLSPNHIEITEKYTTVDAICTSKNPLSFTIRKDLVWAGRAVDLPQSYMVEAGYLNQVKESLMPEVQSQIPTTEIPENVSVDVIRAVMQAPLKAELKLCTTI